MGESGVKVSEIVDVKVSARARARAGERARDRVVSWASEASVREWGRGQTRDCTRRQRLRGHKA
eukprot:3108680-Pleurochrysis_carterae.AAC.1